MRHPSLPRYGLSLLVLAASALPLAAQSTSNGQLEKRPSIAVLGVDLDWANANVVLADDERVGAQASDVLRAEVGTRGRYDVVDSARLARAVGSATSRGERCNTIRCALDVGRALGADRVLSTKLTKISTPVWFLSAYLVDVPTGRVVKSEEFELKGVPAQIIPKGLAVLARRMSIP
jgi:hypothetical protein